jgi:hypothetical protein
MLNVKRQAAATDGKTAVLVGEFGGTPTLVRYAGDWTRRAAMDALIVRAAGKLGWKRDGRCKCGYRKVSA